MTQEEAKVMWPLIKAWGEGANLQVRDLGKWVTGTDVAFNAKTSAYRLEPKPREWWVNVYSQNTGGALIYPTAQLAEKYAGNDRIECVKVREVFE